MTRSLNRTAAPVLMIFLACAGGQAEPAAPPPPPMEPPPGAPPPPPADLDSVSMEPAPSPEPAPASSLPGAAASSPILTEARSAAGPLPPLPFQAPHDGTSPTTEPPAASQWVHPYSNGQWVYSSEYGWIWVPADATTSEADGAPYTYLYTPRFGWTWYLSPWGWGAYHYGPWVTHPWHPNGWHHGWVAHPQVVIRLGGARHHHH